tara:strand:- start:421 stop:684 length:264 start_codon:yes stop_codon:yes gene_type:complete
VPIPGDGNSVADYLHSSDNVIKTEWEKKFVLWPRTSVTKKRIWLRYAYRREVKMRIELPQLPVNSSHRVEWATWDEIAFLKLTGKWT